MITVEDLANFVPEYCKDPRIESVKFPNPDFGYKEKECFVVTLTDREVEAAALCEKVHWTATEKATRKGADSYSKGTKEAYPVGMEGQIAVAKSLFHMPMDLSYKKKGDGNDFRVKTGKARKTVEVKTQKTIYWRGWLKGCGQVVAKRYSGDYKNISNIYIFVARDDENAHTYFVHGWLFHDQVVDWPIEASQTLANTKNHMVPYNHMNPILTIEKAIPVLKDIIPIQAFC